MRKAITGLALFALVAGVALVAVSLSQAPSALAQETEDQVFHQPLEDVLDDLVEDEVITKDQRDKIAAAFEDQFVRFGRGHQGTPHLETVAEVLGMDVDELATQLREGSTIAEVAGDKTNDVVDALVAEHTARIDEAVEEGRLTKEQADEVRAAVAGQVEAMVNGECTGVHPFGIDRFHGPRGFDFFSPPRGIDGFGLRGGLGLDTIADALGLDTDELMRQLADGSSLAEIADEQKVEVSDLVDAVLAHLDEQLDRLVADERLTRERADELRGSLAAGIDSMINGETPGLRFKFDLDGGRHFPHFNGPGHGHGRGIPGPGGFFNPPDEVEGTGSSA